MNSIFSYVYRRDAYMPMVRAYYDRADMVATTGMETSHLHSVSEIMYVSRGYAEVIVHPEETVPLRAGEFIWLDAFVGHKLSLSPQSACGMLNVEFDLVPALSGCPRLRDAYARDAALREMLDRPTPLLVLSDHDGVVHRLMKQIVQLAESAQPAKDALSSMLMTTLLQVMAGLRQEAETQAPAQYPRPVAEALRIVQTRYAQPLTAKAIAAELHVHPSYLHRLIRRHTGKTLHDWLLEARMQAAKKLLADTDMRPGDIAEAVGIASPQYFAQRFRQATSMSPLVYRKTLPKE